MSKSCSSSAAVEVDHVTVFRWVQRFAPLLADAARLARHAPGDRWFVDETYVKVNGVWRYVYRAIDQDLVAQDQDLGVFFPIAPRQQSQERDRVRHTEVRQS